MRVHLRSGPLAAWAGAWLRGGASTDDLLDAVRGGDGPHLVLAVDDGLNGAAPHGATPAGLVDVLAHWRRTGAAPVLVLPVPGDLRGVPGPAAFRTAALDAGEAVHGGGLGLAPRVQYVPASSAPPTVVWDAFVVGEAPADHVQVGEAGAELAEAIRECAAALRAAEVAGSAVDVDDQLRDARRAGERLNLPPGWSPRAVALLAQAERLQAVLDLTRLDPVGGAVDRAGMTARTDALRPLAVAVRRARLAAYNAPAG